MLKKNTFMLPENKYHLCLNKSILKISGSDRFNFLQGMVSNDLEILEKTDSIYCAFLTPQGKFLYDFYIINHKNFFYLECLKKKEDEIIKKFQLYKLRAEVSFNKMQDMVSILINHNLREKLEKNKIEYLIHFSDPRNKNFFLKVFGQRSATNFLQKNLGLSQIDQNDFEKIRISNSIPEAEKDIVVGKTLLLEVRFDKLNGVSWDKGCYIGQEVTAITNYRAKLKKQIYGVKIEGKISSNEITYNGKNVGILTSHMDDFGIAILNIKETENCINHKHSLKSNEALLTPFKPKWSKDSN